MSDLDGVIIGEVRYFAGDYVPAGFVECNGSSYLVTNSDFVPLYAIIGTTYGGLENHSFQVPNIKPKDSNRVKAIIAYRGQFPPRS